MDGKNFVKFFNIFSNQNFAPYSIQYTSHLYFYNIADDVTVMAGKSCNDLEEPETSSVTVKNGCSEVGGYDCDFVESPADDLLCKICHYPARDPVLTECCGQNFCSRCLERYLQSTVIDHSSCPYCREEKFQTMPDKKTKRSVLNLKVFCPHKYQGCTWIGELRSMEDHVNENFNNSTGCLFTELQCSNGCGVVMQCRLVEGHLKSECELREVKCEYCNTTGSYQWINSSHREECPKYPVECPNHCEVGHVRREEISGHLEECPLAIMECPYAAVGCESVVRRKEEMEHVMGSVGQHMKYNKNAILANQNKFQKRLDAKEQEMEKVKQDLRAKERELDDIKRDLQATRDGLDTKEQGMMSINKDIQDKLKQSQEMQSQLKTAISEKGRELDELRKNAEENNKMIQQLKDKLEGTEQSLQHQLKVNTQLQLQVETISNSTWPLQLNYLANSCNEVVPVVIKLVEFKEYKNNEAVHSIGFYTRDGGYKMCLSMYPNGSAGYDNYVSVSARLTKGDHDDHLTWPVKGTLTVQLLNQLSDSNHSEPVKFQFNGSSNVCQRVMYGTKSTFGLLGYRFMPHKRLSYDAGKKCQYLKDDCVYFRVCNFQ